MISVWCRCRLRNIQDALTSRLHLGVPDSSCILSPKHFEVSLALLSPWLCGG